VDNLTLRQRKILRWGSLKNERASWLARYQEISNFLLPFSGRFFTQDRNRGDKSFNNILDSTATGALDILSAGLMAGMTSPARPWFRLAVADNKVMERPAVKVWLNDVAELMRDIFARSNTYRALHSMYEELGSFATAVNIVDNNFKTVIWNSPLTAGEYAIGVDKLGRVNSMYREYEMTVSQIVEDFGNRNPRSGSIDWSNISTTVKSLWENGRGYDQWVPVIHGIEPREFSDREYGKKDAKNKPWASCYLELGTDGDKILRESGYSDCPLLAPRWHTRGRDIYGNGCSFKALGDIKQLQHEQLRKGQAIDYQTLPPVVLPAELEGREVDSLPGGITYAGSAALSGARGHNLMDVQIELNALLADIQDVRQRIGRAFYADLFRMLSDDQRLQPVTAREIAEKHEEKLLMLGPVLERLHDEMLAPLIDITFAKMVQAGMLPPAPPEMQSMDLKVEFVSMLAQAQRAVGLGSVDRLIGTVSLIAQGSGDSSVWDKLDKDEIIDKYSDMLAVDPTLIVADEKIAIIRANRQKAAQMQQAAAAAPGLSQVVKNLGSTPTGERNALTDLTQQVQGHTYT
jgi:hypothetical protein